MKMTGLLHAPAALSPGKEPPVSIELEAKDKIQFGRRGRTQKPERERERMNTYTLYLYICYIYLYIKLIH